MVDGGVFLPPIICIHLKSIFRREVDDMKLILATLLILLTTTGAIAHPCGWLQADVGPTGEVVIEAAPGSSTARP